MEVNKITVGGNSPKAVVPPVNSVTNIEDEIKLRQLQLLILQQETEEYNKGKRLAAEEQYEKDLAAKKRSLESMAKESISGRRQEERAQSFCSHMTDRGTPDTASSKDYQGNIIMVCQQCFKQWNQSEPNFPHNLVHKTRLIGGYGSE